MKLERAATGRGKQDPLIVAVQNKETCDILRKMNAEIMGTEADPYYGAPTIIIVFASADWKQCERRKFGSRQYDACSSPL